MVQPPMVSIDSQGKTTQTKSGKFEIVENKSLKNAPKFKKKWVPPRYRIIEVEKKIADANLKEILVPEQRINLAYLKKTNDGEKVTKRVLCHDKLSKQLVISIQNVLNRHGFTTTINGQLDPSTIANIHKFQMKSHIDLGPLDIQTLAKMGLTAH